MDDSALVLCPYCLQQVELFVDPETRGTYVEDCELCCHPWRVEVARDPEGNPLVTITRADD